MSTLHQDATASSTSSFSSSSSAYSYGGGVYVGGTFTMTGGEISGNTVSSSSSNGSAYSSGGGVYAGGTFRIVTGTVYGSGEGALSNTADEGVAFYLTDNGIAQCGIFDGETWNSNGDLSTTNNTIIVNGGVR